jgi:hypothetical protein
MTRGLAIACIAAAGCARASADEAPPPVRFEHDMIVRLHMHDSFDLLRAIEKLLVRGRVDEARGLAKGIATAPDEPGLGPFSEQAALVRERAAAIGEAATTTEACHAVAELANACAGCHVAAGVVPEFRSPGRVPPDQPTVEARMARHLWATDRLWEGIVGGADDSWRDGLDVLAAAPLRDGIGPERARFGRQLQQLADRARSRHRVADRADRVRSYGEILTTCSGCHAAAPGDSRR